MTRKWIFLPAMLVGTALFLSSTAADAHPQIIVQPAPIFVPPPITVYRPVTIVYPHHHHYRVVYRASCYQPWSTYAIYHSRHAAFDSAARLRFRGFETTVLQ